MFRGLAMPAAVLAAALSLAAGPAVAAPATGAPLAGSVCFYTGAGQHGQSWCYTPPGYTDVPEFLHDKAAAYRSDADTDVYAIDWARDTCYYRLIRAHDLADNWPWGARLDGVADTTMDCQVG
ncbi:hypothetical protein ACFV6E_35640 [Streptomyces sp. NPDC059785]|uniref:hypothetical protein n=1 Tax=unclassified Streptomyces TaxID=2593676 RepID=UPI00364A301F